MLAMVVLGGRLVRLSTSFSRFFTTRTALMDSRAGDALSKRRGLALRFLAICDIHDLALPLTLSNSTTNSLALAMLPPQRGGSPPPKRVGAEGPGCRSLPGARWRWSRAGLGRERCCLRAMRRRNEEAERQEQSCWRRRIFDCRSKQPGRQDCLLLTKEHAKETAENAIKKDGNAQKLLDRECCCGQRVSMPF